MKAPAAKATKKTKGKAEAKTPEKHSSAGHAPLAKKVAKKDSKHA